MYLNKKDQFEIASNFLAESIMELDVWLAISGSQEMIPGQILILDDPKLMAMTPIQSNFWTCLRRG